MQSTLEVTNPPWRLPDIAAAAVAPWPTELDGRGPTPPKTIVAVMTALQAIPVGHPQFFRTNEEPTELLRALAKRGVDGCPARLADGTWRTLLTYRGSGECAPMFKGQRVRDKG